MARHEGAMTIFLAPINLSHSISLLRERRSRPAGEQYKALLWATTHRLGHLFAEFMFAEKRGRERDRDAKEVTRVNKISNFFRCAPGCVPRETQIDFLHDTYTQMQQVKMTSRAPMMNYLRDRR
jgi:hypothetical protein